MNIDSVFIAEKCVISFHVRKYFYQHIVLYNIDSQIHNCIIVLIHMQCAVLIGILNSFIFFLNERLAVV